MLSSLEDLLKSKNKDYNCTRQESGEIQYKKELVQMSYPRLRVVGFLPFGVAAVVPEEAVIGIFSFCLPFAFSVGAFQ